MKEPVSKRTAAEIGAYFDGEVERFSDLARGQASIKDARLMMDLFAETGIRDRNVKNGDRSFRRVHLFHFR